MAGKKPMPMRNGGGMPMDDKEMARCMKSGKSHSQCMKQMGNGKSSSSKKKSSGKKPPY